ncbi:hypothetical protein ATANTOWER_011513 [Ataeniobius toweri]|uniref:Uncharacterized protein n=1 Tax=Ataeniobius toweri TaxID=208326 RepID=A0ABU7BR30_9TELE|nr:hypothetical protein [Ataeniobius toweri]
MHRNGLSHLFFSPLNYDIIPQALRGYLKFTSTTVKKDLNPNPGTPQQYVNSQSITVLIVYKLSPGRKRDSGNPRDVMGIHQQNIVPSRTSILLPGSTRRGNAQEDPKHAGE